MSSVTALKPTCPYCGHEIVDAWELDFGPGLEGDTRVTCGICDREYTLCRIVEIAYTSFELKEDL